MLTGNITLNKRPTEDDLAGTVCCECGQDCECEVTDESFADEFGQVMDWVVVSLCCGAEVKKGGVE